MSLFMGDDNIDDDNDEEFMRELVEIKAIETAVNKQPTRRNEGKTMAKKGGAGKGKQTAEKQLMGEIDSDIDDDELEAELLALMDSDTSNNLVEKNKSEESPSSSNQLSIVPPVRSSSQTSATSTPIQKQADSKVIPPPLPPRRTSDVPEQTEDTKSKARNLLLRRREAFATNARLAVEDGNSDYAKECAETVMMFDQALEACEEQEITMEDLAEIPKTPPPYKKKIAPPTPGTVSLEQELQIRIAKFKELAADYEKSEDMSRARAQLRLCSKLEEALKLHKKGRPIQPETLPAPRGFDALPALQVPASGNSQLSAPSKQRSASPSPARIVEISPQEKAEMLRAKALEYKKAALAAKKKGDLAAASKYLQAAKKVESEAETLIPSQIQQPTSSKNSGEIHLIPASKLLVNLKHQLEMVMKLQSQFKVIKDVKRTLFYDELIKRCSADLKICYSEIKSGHNSLMRYKINELNLPVLEINPGMPADVLELKIVSISNLRMPEGWKVSDAQTFVSYEFPFPHDAHQTGRSQIIYKTDNPEFDETFQLKINRKTRQLQRISQRMPIKLSVYQKGGFLRSDKFCGEADIPFGDVNNQATVHIEQDLLDHRKKTGAKITVEIRVQKPLDDKKMNAVKTYPWIRLDSTSL